MTGMNLGRLRAIGWVFPLLALIFAFAGGLTARVGGTGEQKAGRPDTLKGVSAEYAIQVGAFSVLENALTLSDRLQAAGLQSVIYENLLDGRNTLHLVWVGRYRKPEEAGPDLERIERLTGIRGVLRERMLWKQPVPR